MAGEDRGLVADRVLHLAVAANHAGQPGRDLEERLAGLQQGRIGARALGRRSEEHTSELQSLMRISYAVFCLQKKTTPDQYTRTLDRKRQNTAPTRNKTKSS